MNKITVILPIYNLRKRGLKRVANSVFSLQSQKCDIIVVDGSEFCQFAEMRQILKGLRVEHIHAPTKEFNKPVLLNVGIDLAKTEYVFCSDGDYIFKRDLIEELEKIMSPNRLIHKKVKMLPSTNVTRARIVSWKFPKCRFNEWNTLANGGMQFASKKFFEDNPYNEEMSGFGAMDNLTTYVAYNHGFAIVWMEESEILHQNHPIERKISGSNKIKFDRNQKILAEYIKKHNLPKLLSR